MWTRIALLAVAVLGCTPARGPEAKDLPYQEAVRLETVAREAAIPAYDKCRKEPAPGACDAYLDLLLDTLFRARQMLDDRGRWGVPGMTSYYGCLMTEAQTYLAQMDQTSYAVSQLDPYGRPCPR